MKHLLAALTLAALSLAQLPAEAQAQDGNYDAVDATYSPRMKGQFQFNSNFQIPGFGQFPGVRVTKLDFNSPLRSIGIEVGDVITRLDGIRVDSTGRLEMHYSVTEVRWIKQGTTFVQRSHVNLGPQNSGPIFPNNGGGIAP